MMFYLKGILGICFGVLTVAFGAGLLASAAYLVSLSALMVPIGALTLPIVAVRFFGIGRAVCRYGERYLTHTATFAILADLRTGLYRKIEPIAPLGLADARSEVARAIVFDVDVLEQWYVRVLTPAVVALVTYIAGGVILYLIAPTLAATYLIGALLCALLAYLGRAYTHQAQTRLQRSRSHLSSALTELVGGLIDARAARAQKRLYEEEMQAIEQTHLEEERLLVREAILTGASETIAQITVWAILVGACYAAANDSLSGVWLAPVVLGISACMEALVSLVGAARYHDTVAQAHRQLTETIGKTHPIEQQAPLRSHRLVFDHVSYEAGGRKIVDDVSFTVEEGEHIAIVGTSGSGKTTLMRMIYGYTKPTSGVVTIGSVRTDKIAQGEIEQHCAPIPQEIDLFAGTAEDNLRLADPTASEKQIAQIWQEAELTDVDPKRELTALGRELSGGQRQRFALARYLLIADRPLAVWDEPLSHLSADMAARLDKRLMATRKGKTLILITHRLTGLDTFDRILVIEQGRIIEQGTEQQLLAQQGHYCQLKHAWQQHIDVEDADV